MITAPSVVEKGIAIYVPRQEEFTQVHIRIIHSAKNPLFEWEPCNKKESVIWEKTDYAYNNGILFVYTSNTKLKKGFYTIEIKALAKNNRILRGSEIYGVLKEKDSLHIGLPYSKFSPIVLN